MGYHLDPVTGIYTKNEKVEKYGIENFNPETGLHDKKIDTSKKLEKEIEKNKEVEKEVSEIRKK